MVTREDELFDELVLKLIKDVLELYPTAGTHLGLHEYDLLLPKLSKEAMEKAIKLVEYYYKEFSSIDKEKLTGYRRVDYEPLLNGLLESMITLRDWPTWRMYPTGFMVAGEALYSLIIREHLPLEHRLNALYNRVKGLGKMIDESLSAVDEPYSLWIDYVMLSAKGMPSLIELVKAMGLKHGYNELAEACEKLKEEFSKYMEALQKLKEKAKPGFKPIGPELYRKLLKARMIDEDIEELRKQGYAEAEKYRKLMLEEAKKIGANSISEALEKIKENHISSPEKVLEEYRRTIEYVKKFVVEKEAVELPPMENIRVVETPEFMRPILPFAAYMPPEIFGWSFTGIFFVTPPANEEMLKHHNVYDILNTIVHEAYPGHHTQLVYAKLNPYLTRKILIQANEFIEGWAHYTEELMLELGIDKSPEYKLKVYHDTLWRAVRVYVDVELSTGMITFEQAVEKLVKDAYLPRDGAFSEALRYTMSPGYQISYNYGKRRIIALREKVKEILGERFSYKLFHKLLLEEGNLPLKVLEKLVVEKAYRIAKTIEQG